MKRLFTLFATLSMLLCGCASFEEQNNTVTLPATHDLQAGFAEDTRTYVENNKYLRWHEDDRLTAFYGNTLNRQYKFNGTTGANSGTFSLVPSGELGTGNAFDRIYAVYPYNETATITDEGEISLTLPAVQSYAENSFGKGANTMVAVTENLEDTFLAFKNACGYLKLKLYGDNVTLASIEVKGNNNEKIAGSATATMEFGGVPTLAMNNDATTTVTLDCGESVVLGTTAETATEFWIVLPETTFEGGITITATDTDGKVFEKSTTKTVAIVRNEIQPMAAIEAICVKVQPKNTIYYTATQKVEPYDKTVFGATYQSNEWDSETGEGVITFDGELTTIGERAFLSCPNLTSVTIPDSVTTIGDEAFRGCAILTSVTIPDSVTTIGNGAFYNCRRLTSATIGNSVTTIGDRVFYFCNSLTSVTIPDSVTTIGEDAFSNCHSLTSVTIPDSVTTIGNSAFHGCRSLTSVTIGNSVTTIGDGVFADCSNLVEFKGKFAADGGRCLIKDNTLIAYAKASGTTYTIPDSVTTIGDRAFYSCDSLTSITIPDSVTTIGEYAFSSCSSLTSVTIPDSVTTIGDSAFLYCSSLTSVTIPNSVTTIGDSAFSYCSSLTSVTIPDSVTTIGNWVFSSCSSLTSVTISDSVMTIGNGVFDCCESLTSVTIPNSVTTIGAEAFSSCSSLTSVTIPDSVTTIGDEAFYYCTSLTSVTIPDSVTTIGGHAFCYCSSLTSVTIGDNVTMIGDFAFCNCSSLTSVYCEATTPPTLGGSYVFDINKSGRKIYVTAESVEEYKAAENWSEYADYIVGYDFETGEVVE